MQQDQGVTRAAVADSRCKLSKLHQPYEPLLPPFFFLLSCTHRPLCPVTCLISVSLHTYSRLVMDHLKHCKKVQALDGEGGHVDMLHGI